MTKYPLAYEIARHDEVQAKQYEDEIKSTKMHANERQIVQDKGDLYTWRNNYPHCNNVYFKDIQTDEQVSYLPNPYESAADKQTLFNNGGISYLANPFNDDIFVNEEIDKLIFNGLYKRARLEKLKDLTLDDLADAASTKIDLSGTTTESVKEPAKDKPESEAKGKAESENKDDEQDEAEGEQDQDE